MDDEIQSLIDELDVIVMYDCDLDDYGHAIFPPILDGTAVIYIEDSLSEIKQQAVLIHELGHVAKQRNEKELYDVTMNMKIKMEYGANLFMIQHLFDDYINETGIDPRLVNYIEFMRQCDIPSRQENIVKEVILNY